VSSVRVDGEAVAAYKVLDRNITVWIKSTARNKGIIKVWARTKPLKWQEIDGVCTASISVLCQACDCNVKRPVISGLPSSMAKGATATLYAYNGCGPYVWTVSGAGTLSSSITNEGENTILTATDANCGAGGSATLLVGVTDTCTNVATGWIRVTGNGADWVQHEEKDARVVGGGYGSCTIFDDPTCALLSDPKTITSGQYKWVLSGVGWCVCSAIEWWVPPAFYPPPCGDPTDCAAANGNCTWTPADCGVGAPPPCECIYRKYKYYEWECP
jgi:hypothetical protein